MTLFEIKDEDDVREYCKQTFYCNHCYFWKECESKVIPHKSSENYEKVFGDASKRLEMFQKIIRRLKLKKLLEK